MLFLRIRSIRKASDCRQSEKPKKAFQLTREIVDLLSWQQARINCVVALVALVDVDMALNDGEKDVIFRRYK